MARRPTVPEVCCGAFHVETVAADRPRPRAVNRRSWGGMLLLLVLAAAMLLPASAGRRTAGHPARVPASPPPSVGDCLTGDLDPGGSALVYSTVGPATATVGACADRSHGEIVAVAVDAHDFPANGTGQPEPLACLAPARAYLGLPGGSDDGGETAPGVAASGWRPLAAGTVRLIGPDRMQYADGQRWVACALLPQDKPYAGSVRDAVFGPAASAYSLCRERDGTGYRAVRCAAAHTTELFGVASRAALQGDPTESCRALVAALTNATEPTRDGALSIEIVRGTALSRTAADNPDPASELVVCAVTVPGDRRLTASLLGIGDRPLPGAG